MNIVSLLDIGSLIFTELMMKLMLLVSLMATCFFTAKVEGGTKICDRDINNLSACAEKFVSYEKLLMLPFYVQSFCRMEQCH